MSTLNASRDSFYRLMTDLNASKTPNVVNALRTIVAEMHQVAGLTHAALQRVEAAVTSLDQRLTALELSVGTGVDEASNPEHSALPSFDTFRTFKSEGKRKK